METIKTNLADSIFQRITARHEDAVFLYKPQNDPLLLTFGWNCIQTADYFIRLIYNGHEITLSSKDLHPFVLLMDYWGTSKKVRLVLYRDGNAMPEIEYISQHSNQELEGEVLILAQDDKGMHFATLYATFEPGEGNLSSDSLLIDSSKGVFKHFFRYFTDLTKENF